MDKSSTVKISTARKTSVIEIPSMEGAQVEVYGSIVVGDTIGIDITAIKDENANPGDILKLVTRLIKDWNLVDDNYKMLEITEENVGQLGQEDLVAIINSIVETANTQKKT